jgi:phage host-nuclease inhibitor protein Gam
MLAKILNRLNLPTLATILLMGGGNFFATKSSGDGQRQEIEKAIRQINDLHMALSEFETRQKEEIAKAQELINNQSQMLRNQTRMLDNQMNVLQQMKQPK